MVPSTPEARRRTTTVASMPPLVRRSTPVKSSVDPLSVARLSSIASASRHREHSLDAPYTSFPPPPAYAFASNPPSPSRPGGVPTDGWRCPDGLHSPSDWGRCPDGAHPLPPSIPRPPLSDTGRGALNVSVSYQDAFRRAPSRGYALSSTVLGPHERLSHVPEEDEVEERDATLSPPVPVALTHPLHAAASAPKPSPSPFKAPSPSHAHSSQWHSPPRRTSGRSLHDVVQMGQWLHLTPSSTSASRTSSGRSTAWSPDSSRRTLSRDSGFATGFATPSANRHYDANTPSSDYPTPSPYSPQLHADRFIRSDAVDDEYSPEESPDTPRTIDSAIPCRFGAEDVFGSGRRVDSAGTLQTANAGGPFLPAGAARAFRKGSEWRLDMSIVSPHDDVFYQGTSVEHTHDGACRTGSQSLVASVRSSMSVGHVAHYGSWSPEQVTVTPTRLLSRTASKQTYRSSSPRSPTASPSPRSQQCFGDASGSDEFEADGSEIWDDENAQWSPYAYSRGGRTPLGSTSPECKAVQTSEHASSPFRSPARYHGTRPPPTPQRSATPWSETSDVCTSPTRGVTQVNDRASTPRADNVDQAPVKEEAHDHGQRESEAEHQCKQRSSLCVVLSRTGGAWKVEPSSKQTRADEPKPSLSGPSGFASAVVSPPEHSLPAWRGPSCIHDGLLHTVSSPVHASPLGTKVLRSGAHISPPNVQPAEVRWLKRSHPAQDSTSPSTGKDHFDGTLSRSHDGDGRRPHFHHFSSPTPRALSDHETAADGRGGGDGGGGERAMWQATAALSQFQSRYVTRAQRRTIQALQDPCESSNTDMEQMDEFELGALEILVNMKNGDRHEPRVGGPGPSQSQSEVGSMGGRGLSVYALGESLPALGAGTTLRRKRQRHDSWHQEETVSSDLSSIPGSDRGSSPPPPPVSLAKRRNAARRAARRVRSRNMTGTTPHSHSPFSIVSRQSAVLSSSASIQPDSGSSASAPTLALPPLPALTPASVLPPDLIRRTPLPPSTRADHLRRTFPTSVPMDEQFPLFYRRFFVPTIFNCDDPLKLVLFGDVQTPGDGVDRSLAEAARRNERCSGQDNPPRGPFDLYTPRLVKGVGPSKVGLCPVCWEDGGTAVWLKMKQSAYNYHMLYAHGISSSGEPFSPPVAYRVVERRATTGREKSEIKEGRCHECNKWVPVEGIKIGMVQCPEIYWWKHAAKCHSSRVIGEQDDFVENAALRRILAYERSDSEGGGGETSASNGTDNIHVGGGAERSGSGSTTASSASASASTSRLATPPNALPSPPVRRIWEAAPPMTPRGHHHTVVASGRAVSRPARSSSIMSISSLTSLEPDTEPSQERQDAAARQISTSHHGTPRPSLSPAPVPVPAPAPRPQAEEEAGCAR